MSIKIGNTEFRQDAAKEMTFEEFKATYQSILKGVSLELAFRQLGGAKVSKKKEKEIED